jgi:hypothetical protein
MGERVEISLLSGCDSGWGTSTMVEIDKRREGARVHYANKFYLSQGATRLASRMMIKYSDAIDNIRKCRW